jgi:colanic acid/amylovoran biosynthesis glycosyltransferase
MNHGMRAIGALNPLVHKRLILGLQPLHQAAAFRRKGQYDILHAQFSDLAQTVLRHRNAGLLNGGLVTHFRGHDITSHIRKYGARAHKEVFARGDWFVANCEHFKRVAIDLGCPPERTSVVPSGACIESFPYRERTAPLGRSVNILAVGRLTPQKGFMSAIHAMSILRAKGISARLRILGEGKDRGILEQEIQLLGLQYHIDLPGAATQQQIAEELDRADLFIAPCMTAPDGAQDAPVNVLKEAMLAGAPVVATRHGGIPELVSHGETGILVEENNYVALADGILEILRRVPAWQRITKSAREVVINRYSMQVSHAALMEAYAACLEHRKGVLSR